MPWYGNAACCCCPTIGFDFIAWPGILTCCQFNASIFDPNANAITDIVDTNFDRLPECKVLFMGLNNECNNCIRFDDTQYAAVADYLNGGGRIWLNSEHEGCLFADFALAEFLTAMGSSMTHDNGSYDNGCVSDGSHQCIAAVPWAEGTSYSVAATAAIGGGTPVWTTPTEHVTVAQEKIGNGILWLSGDSNNFAGCHYEFCDFVTKLWTLDIAEF